MAKSKNNLQNNIAYILIIAGIIGLIASFIITLDKFKLLENASFHPACDLNPVISCGSVMQSKQGSAFGFPNPFIGIGAFAVLITIGMGIKAGAVFKRWFWLGLEFGTIFGIFFIHWLFFQSVYRIHALCPYCMAVWAVTITSFWYVTLYNIDQKNIVLSENLKKPYKWIRRHHLDILILWILIIAGLILKHFWYYYGKFL